MMRRWLSRVHLPIFLLILVALSAHGQMLGRGFVSDDWDWLHIAATAQFPEYFVGNYAGEHAVGGSYRPVVTVVMQMLYALFGLQAIWYHALSLVLLVVTAIGIARLVQTIFASVRQQTWIAWMSALLFVLIPTHAEAVYWVAGLPDMIAAACMVWSSVWMVRWLRYNSWRSVVVAVVLWIIALGAKENAVVLPGIWFACTAVIASLEWDRSAYRSRVWPLLRWFGGAIAILVAFIVLRRYAVGNSTLVYSVAAAQLSLHSAAISLLHTLVAPVVGWHEIRHQIVAWVWEYRVWVVSVVGALGLGTIGYGVRRYGRTTGAALALLAAFMIAAIPNTVVTYHPVFAEGERFAYFPSVFIVVLLAWGCSWLITLQQQLGRAATLMLALSMTIAIPHYHRAWDEADRALATVQQDLTTYAATHSRPQAVLIGLPEFAHTIAPVLRNGLPQWYAMTHDLAPSPYGRLPYYTQWDDRSAMTWVADTNGWKATYATSTSLWGPATYADSNHLVELWGYNYALQRGGNFVKFVYRPDDPRTKSYRSEISPPIIAWSKDGFIPMPQAASLK